MLIYIWFRFEWQFGVGAVIATVHDVTMMVGLYVDLGPGVQPDQHRGDPDHRRLFDQRHRRGLRPRARESPTIQEDADRGAARPVDEPDAVANGAHRRHHAAGADRALSVRRRGHPLVHLRDDLRHPGRHLFVDLRRRTAAHPVQATARKRRQGREERDGGYRLPRSSRKPDADGEGHRDPRGAFPWPRADRRLWQWRLPLRRHVASRLDPLPAVRRLWLGARRSRGARAGRLRAPDRGGGQRSRSCSSAPATTLRPLPEPLRTLFKGSGISADPMSTGAAVRTYNVLLAEDRAVAAALVAVD